MVLESEKDEKITVDIMWDELEKIGDRETPVISSSRDAKIEPT